MLPMALADVRVQGVWSSLPCPRLDSGRKIKVPSKCVMKTTAPNTLKYHLLFALLMSLTLPVALFGQTTIPSTFALPLSAADTNRLGFIWRTHSAGRELENTLARTEAQLAGTLGDNLADPTVAGPAIAPAAPPNPSTAPISFEIPTVINMDQVGGSAGGNFPNDDQLPGIPSLNLSTDGIAGEALTWLYLPAGVITMGVNSDDGFRVSIGGAAPGDKQNAVVVGQFDGGRGNADTIFSFTITQAGLYATRLIWEEGGGGANVEWFSQDTNGTKVLINDTTTGAIPAFRAVTTPPAKAYIQTLLPFPGSGGNAPNAPIRVEIVDGPTPISPTSVKLFLDNTLLSVTPTKSSNVTTAAYIPTVLYGSGSSHNASVVYVDGGTSVTQNWSFLVQTYANIPPTYKVTPDVSKPGFLWNIFANAANQENSNARAQAAVAGLLTDATGAPLPNNADPAAVGAALAPGVASGPTAPIRFEIATEINLTQAATDPVDNQNGNFKPDQQIPGLPATDATTDGVAAEVITYIELPAGLVTMGVNSDDGFKTTVGVDAINALFAGQFEGGRGASDTIFNIFVQEAGVYPLRTVWYEGGGGANIEWFSVTSTGTKVLINSTNAGALKAYRAVSGIARPYVKYVSPGTEPRQLNQVSRSVQLVLVDGTNPVDANSVVLKIDGQTVATTNNRVGNTIVVTYAPSTLRIPTDVYAADLTFKDSTGTVTEARQWQFRNLKNLVLPTPKVVEDFDSYPEDTQPTGWVASNFTAVCDTNRLRDIMEQSSESYLNWVLVNTNNAPLIDGDVLSIAPGQTFNGQPVDGVAVGLSSGNILYGESDSRCNTDAGGSSNRGQTQFIVSKAFDLSQVTNVVLTFSSLYAQNQDSYGGVEYSVDGGTTWMPVVYFLDTPDIVLNGDGTVNAVATFSANNTDTSGWFENGVPKGSKPGGKGYGDGVAAPITQATADAITPRINDNLVEGARIEVFRLPLASRKSDVRLRFSAMGTDSWWFAVDNIAFYDVAGTTTSTTGLRFNAPTFANGMITLSWTGGTAPFLVQAKASLSDTNWENVLTTSNRTVTLPAAGFTRFFRVSENAQTNVTLFTVSLNGANERPTAVTTPATGSGTFSLQGNALTYLIAYSNLSAPASAGHIHGPADTNSAAGVLVGFPSVPAATSATLSGTLTLTDTQKGFLLGNQTYANIHTGAHPGGEIRGQIFISNQ